MQVTFNPLVSNLDYYSFLNSLDAIVPKTVQQAELDNTEVNAVDNQQTQDVSSQNVVQDQNQVSQAQRPAPHTPEAIASFMIKLGLEPTNTKEGDFALISAKLSQLSANAKTNVEKQRVSDFQAEFTNITAQVGNVGQNHKAEMNKSNFNLKS